jgi:2-polyprenyl-6-hydroxyphenyl methylase/3-demethylubiquinone-9 3-methyltransferase
VTGPHAAPAGSDLTDRATHFDFGANWSDFSKLLDPAKVDLAVESVHRLVPDLEGKTFLDVGSGSGVFSVAALRLGAKKVHAIDIDENSVDTTRRVLASFAEQGSWTAERRSVFDLSPGELGHFDVVYSWGVLHHTGDMWRAIDSAARMVAPGGAFAFALYQRTPLCGLWRVEKRAYMRAPRTVQRALVAAYKAAYQAGRFVSGRGVVRGGLERGMNIDHDVHDWLGGYPYESTGTEEVRKHMEALGFEPVAVHPTRIHLAGLFGSGCNEFVYRRSDR